MAPSFGRRIFLTSRKWQATLKATYADFIRPVPITEECPERCIEVQPGRVVTLLPSDDPEARVWGMAYEIADDNVDNVLNHLDYREKCGYEKTYTTFYPSSRQQLIKKPFQLFFYLGGVGNDWYLGEANVSTIAEQIVKSVGPSGTNVDYLLRLAASMRAIAPEEQDLHLFEIESKVLELLKHREIEDLNKG